MHAHVCVCVNCKQSHYISFLCYYITFLCFCEMRTLIYGVVEEPLEVLTWGKTLPAKQVEKTAS